MTVVNSKIVHLATLDFVLFSVRIRTPKQNALQKPVLEGRNVVRIIQAVELI